MLEIPRQCNEKIKFQYTSERIEEFFLVCSLLVKDLQSHHESSLITPSWSPGVMANCFDDEIKIHSVVNLFRQPVLSPGHILIRAEMREAHFNIIQFTI